MQWEQYKLLHPLVNEFFATPSFRHTVQNIICFSFSKESHGKIDNQLWLNFLLTPTFVSSPTTTFGSSTFDSPPIFICSSSPSTSGRSSWISSSDFSVAVVSSFSFFFNKRAQEKLLFLHKKFFFSAATWSCWLCRSEQEVRRVFSLSKRSKSCSSYMLFDRTRMRVTRSRFERV